MLKKKFFVSQIFLQKQDGLFQLLVAQVFIGWTLIFLSQLFATDISGKTFGPLVFTGSDYCCGEMFD